MNTPNDVAEDARAPMSFEERRHWIYAFAVLATSGAYVGIIASRAHATPVAEIAYIKPMLWAIGASIIATIALTIAAAIGAEVKAAVVTEIAARAEGRVAEHRAGSTDVGKTDRRDKEIDRYGEWAGHWVIIAGAVAALILAMLDVDTFWIANAIFVAFSLASICSSIVKIVVYRRGFWS